jgi:hypothetical protein
MGFKCKTIIIGQQADFRGIDLYTRINGCASHSDVDKTIIQDPRIYCETLRRKDWENAVIVGIEQIAKNAYKVWYQPYKNGRVSGDQFHAILTKREYDFTIVRDTLIREYHVPVELIDNLVYTAELVKEEENNVVITKNKDVKGEWR